MAFREVSGKWKKCPVKMKVGRYFPEMAGKKFKVADKGLSLLKWKLSYKKRRYRREYFFERCPVNRRKCPVKIKIGRYSPKMAGIFSTRQVKGPKWQIKNPCLPKWEPSIPLPPPSPKYFIKSTNNSCRISSERKET
ncbi:hypothetical protein V7266_00580 [Neobacillus drentensis]|uniref:hypothetical protein n=1 Tax=Neobacillus drentensis TaxID=220684 RepID=UPI0030005450